MVVYRHGDTIVTDKNTTETADLTIETISLTLRLPRRVHDQLIALRGLKPHMSLNALIVEAADQYTSAHESGQARETAASIGGLK
jgi:hypothetical protein